MNVKVNLERMWINQPSTLQSLHEHHGMNVLACKIAEDLCIIYPVKGDVISMEVPCLCLSKGWIDDE